MQKSNNFDDGFKLRWDVWKGIDGGSRKRVIAIIMFYYTRSNSLMEPRFSESRLGTPFYQGFFPFLIIGIVIL